MSDSGEEIFLTQNTFRKSDYDSESEVEFAMNYLAGVGDQTLDEYENRPAAAQYQPSTSDISDGELVATCQVMERQEKGHKR
jgi:hypothetical protein